MRVKRLPLIVVCVLAAAPAVQATTPGTVTLMSTFESISVRAKYTGDPNENNSAAIQFKKTTDGTWLNAYPPIVDRRTTVNGNDNTAYAFEARGSIVGLTPNTPYDVRITWNDPDGISGSASLSSVITTLSYNPPANGSTRWVDGSVASEGNGTSGNPFKTITNAIQQSNAGDTIIVKAGNYASFTIAKPGNAAAYFVLKANPGDIVTIQSSASSNLTIDADYWRIMGFHFSPSVESSMVIAANRHHIYIEDNITGDVGTGNVWGSGAVSIRTAANNIYILRNQFNRAASGTNNVDGVFVQNGGNNTLVIADNQITGNFWDGIGNGCNCMLQIMENSDFARNSITHYQDDSIEMDGASINLRAWGNTVSTLLGHDLISEAGTIVGPSYIFRNTFLNSNPNASGVKQGNGGVGYCFMFHNVFQTTGGGSNEGLGEAGGPPSSENHTYRNNIFSVSGNAYYNQGRSNSYDYNLLYAPASLLINNFNGANYSTLAEFQSGTAQESHGINANPILSTDQTIQSGSPAIDKGVIIPNFNSLDSAWPYGGSSPDIGAYEYGNVPVTPPPGNPNSSGLTPNATFNNFKNVINPTKDAPLTIQYSAAGNDITLTVYDRKGNEVKALDRGSNIGNDYTTAWDGRNRSGSVVASGTYILVLKQGGVVQKKKVMVVK